jgi:glucuronosyltransferase
MKKMSAISKDEAESPLNQAVWWAEYVIRHNGAKHLRSAALDLSWYQYLLVDVIVFLILISVTTVVVSYLILKNICLFLCAKWYKVKSKHH